MELKRWCAISAGDVFKALTDKDLRLPMSVMGWENHRNLTMLAIDLLKVDLVRHRDSNDPDPIIDELILISPHALT